MALVASASQFSAVAHVLGLTAAILVIVWVVHYGGGADLNSDNTDLIFNAENKMAEKKPMTIEKKLVAENALAEKKHKVGKRILPKGGHKKKKKKKKNSMDSYKIYILVHPLVMTLGFILVIGEAIMAYNTVPSRKTVQKSIHMLLHLLALGLGVLGIYAAFKFHNESQIPNMYTLHSWLGICTICLFGLQWIFGFFNFWFPGAPPMTRTMLVPLHATAGLAIFLMAICTAETGFMEKGGGGPGAETRLINFAGLMILLFGLFVSLSTALPRIMS